MYILKLYTVCIELYVLLQDLYPLVLYQKCILELSITERMNTVAHVSGCIEVVKNLNKAVQPSDDQTQQHTVANQRA
jgi:hypothetical protein